MASIQVLMGLHLTKRTYTQLPVDHVHLAWLASLIEIGWPRLQHNKHGEVEEVVKPATAANCGFTIKQVLLRIVISLLIHLLAFGNRHSHKVSVKVLYCPLLRFVILSSHTNLCHVALFSEFSCSYVCLCLLQ